MPDDLLETLELVKRMDGGSDVDVVDLHDWLKLPDGWIQASAEDDEPVDEVLTLNINATSVDDLADILQDIDEKIIEIKQARDATNPYGVWLRAQLTGETNARQAYLLRGRRSNQLRVSSPALWSSALPQYSLGLTRMSGWEAASPTQIPVSPGAVSGNGGTIAYTLGGVADARVALVTTTAGLGLDQLWFGIKSDLYGVTPANFVARWPLYQSKVTASDIATASDSTAAAGTKIVCSFSSSSAMRYIASPTVGEIAPTYPGDQRGKYLVLLRAQTSVTGSLLCNVRIGQGYRVSTDYRSFSFGNREPIGGFPPIPGWVNYPLGVVTIPPVDSFYTQGLTQVCLAVQAEKISGTGDLELDSLILIPAEHNIHVGYSTAVIGVGSAQSLIATRPDLRKSAIVYRPIATEYISSADPPDDMNWAIPPGSGVIVCAAGLASGIAAAASTVLITPTFTVYPAYSSLRGAA